MLHVKADLEEHFNLVGSHRDNRNKPNNKHTNGSLNVLHRSETFDFHCWDVACFYCIPEPPHCLSLATVMTACVGVDTET